MQYYKLAHPKSSDIHSPKIRTKFKAPPGVTKTYKKVTTPIPRWMQQMQKSSNLPNAWNKHVNLNGNARTTLSEVFNLDEKRNYKDLIRRMASTTRPVSIKKPVGLISLAEDVAAFRKTQQCQRNSLNELKLLEKGLAAEQESTDLNEYDPITVASINSSDSEVEIVPSESSSSSVRIDPVNTLKDFYKKKPVTADNWISELDSKYKEKKKQTQEKLAEAKRESDIMSKVIYEQNLAHLQRKLKYELSIPECLIVEPQPTVELPKLTPDQEKVISRALGPGPSNQVIVTKFNLSIHRCVYFIYVLGLK